MAKEKPDCELVGQDGNIFNLMCIASHTLQNSGMAKEAAEMSDVENYPYTILFNLSGDTPVLCKEESRLQFRRSGYSLKVDNNMLVLFTWRILEQLTTEKVGMLVDYYRQNKRPMIELPNGWYNIEVLGGETMQDADYEPTFEFVIQPADGEKPVKADMNLSFRIDRSTY